MPITISLRGRLGNQIFQLSAMIAYALKNNMEYEIPKHTANDEVWPPYFAHLHVPLKKAARVGISYLEEESHAYKELPVIDKDDLFLWTMKGYFQSYKYFENYKDEISEILGFEKLPVYRRSVSLHYRAGDYKNYPLLHPMVTMEYFRQAVAQFNDMPCFFDIYSDDIEWCMENLNNDFFDSFGCGHTVHYNYPQDPLEDLKMFSTANNHIISNSTWSYCGSYFGSGKGKTITPHEDNWMGINNKHLDVSTLLPKNWIRIKY